MKLIRFGPPGAEKPGLLLADGTRRDASAFGEDWNEAFFGLGRPRAARGVGPRRRGGGAASCPDDVRLGPPVARPSKIVCIGLNYADHARETGAAIPDRADHLLQGHDRAVRAGRRPRPPARLA